MFPLLDLPRQNIIYQVILSQRWILHITRHRMMGLKRIRRNQTRRVCRIRPTTLIKLVRRRTTHISATRRHTQTHSVLVHFVAFPARYDHSLIILRRMSSFRALSAWYWWIFEYFSTCNKPNWTEMTIVQSFLF